MENIWAQRAKKVFDFAVSQWFFIFLGALIALAHSYPEFGKQGGTVKAQYTIEYGAVGLIFLVSGLSMSTKLLMKNFYHWRAHFTVLSLSFLFTSAFMYGVVTGIDEAHNRLIDPWMLIGLIVTHACPTTVSLNVIMTKKAHGNDILTLCEVFVGNVLGAFITPALVQLYLSGRWEFGNPIHQPGGDSSIGDLYKLVMKQVGLSVFVPLFVGQVVQNVFPTQTKWCCSKLYLGKVSLVMLLLIMYQSFCTAFAQHAFDDVPHALIIFLVFFNIGVYLFYTVCSYLYCRPYFILQVFRYPPTDELLKVYKYLYRLFRPFYYDKKDTVAIMLCGPAKTAALGVSLVTSQYGLDSPYLGKLLVPLVLYQAEQVITAQVLVNFMRRWIENERIEDEETAVNEDEEVRRAEEWVDNSSDDRDDNRDDNRDNRDDVSEQTARNSMNGRASTDGQGKL